MYTNCYSNKCKPSGGYDIFFRASKNRDWKNDYSRQATAELQNSKLKFKNIRNNRYPSAGKSYDSIWEDREYNISKLRKLWLLLEPFHPKIHGIAHLFLSFEFEDDFLSLSIEARTTKNNDYSIVKGLFGSFELIYLYGTEKDFFVRRACYLDHQLYLFPLITPPIEILSLLLNRKLSKSTFKAIQQH